MNFNSLKNVDAITVLEDIEVQLFKPLKETFSQIICFYIIYTVLNSAHSVLKHFVHNRFVNW